MTGNYAECANWRKVKNRKSLVFVQAHARIHTDDLLSSTKG